MGLGIISEYKKKLGMTTEALSSASGVPVGTLNKILSGATRDPKLETLKSIAKVLGLSLNDFDDERPISENNLTADEIEHIKKYRLLDEDGKRFVDETLSHESGRADQISGLEQRIADLSGEQEIEEEVEAYRRELELEKRREGEWSGSEEDAG